MSGVTDRFQCVFLGASRGYLWRLVAPNGRERGRSAQNFSDLAECLATIALVRSKIDKAEVVIKRNDAEHRAQWGLRLNGILLAISHTGYQRTIDLNDALAQFKQAAARALVDPVVSTLGKRTAVTTKNLTQSAAIVGADSWSHFDPGSDESDLTQ